MVRLPEANSPPEMFQDSSWDPGPCDGPGNQTDLVSSPLHHMAAVVLGQATDPPLSPSFLLGWGGVVLSLPLLK